MFSLITLKKTVWFQQCTEYQFNSNNTPQKITLKKSKNMLGYNKRKKSIKNNDVFIHKMYVQSVHIFGQLAFIQQLADVNKNLEV